MAAISSFFLILHIGDVGFQVSVTSAFVFRLVVFESVFMYHRLNRKVVKGQPQKRTGVQGC